MLRNSFNFYEILLFLFIEKKEKTFLLFLLINLNEIRHFSM